mgnify:CR=1 FL=1
MDLIGHGTPAARVPHTAERIIAEHDRPKAHPPEKHEHVPRETHTGELHDRPKAHPPEKHEHVPRETHTGELHDRPKGKKVCIICKRERDGTPVEEDFYITTVRELKQRLGWATGNILVVCAEDTEKAKAKRKRFERYLMWYGILAIAVLGIITLSARSVVGFLWGLLVGAFVMAFSMFTYFPRMKEEGKG